MTNRQDAFTRILELINKAEANLDAAKTIMASFPELEGELSGIEKTSKPLLSGHFDSRQEGDVKIIEGIFDGQNMIGPDDKAYPIAANYASKSKLVPGDQLKLSIQPNGSFIYKQIGPVPRKQVVGILSYEDGQYQVLADGKPYQVILASVTYFKAKIGDEITLVIPEHGESNWGAIENVIPQ